MAKASDNIFPKVIEAMQTTDPAAPTDASWKIYAKAPGIYARSSNAIVGPFGAGTGTGTLTTVEEADGSPTNSAVTKLVLPNGRLSIAGTVATFNDDQPTVTNYNATFTGGGTSTIVTMTAPTAGDVMIALVYSTGRTCNSITQTNVVWTQRYTGNGNSQYLEVWTGVVSASAGTTATFAFTGSNNQYCVTFKVNSATAFTSATAATSGTSTAATTALSTVDASGITIGSYVIAATSANAPASAFGAMSLPFTSLGWFGGAGRGGIMRAFAPSLAYWSQSATAVNYFSAVVILA